MRKIVYHIAISVDGFIAAENGSVEDFYMTGEHANDFVSQLQEYDTVIMGKNTYAFGFQFGLQPGKPAYTGLKHIIVSTTMHFENSDDVTLLKTNAIEQINEMKKKKGKDIWLCGGGKLAGYLAKAGLINEVRLKVNPIAIGSGISLFQHLQVTQHLEFLGSKAYINGVNSLSYRIKH